MESFCRYHLSAWVALLLLFGNLLPAFGMGGRWFCPDGSLCPRNGGTFAVHEAHEQMPTHPPCCRSRSTFCCPKESPPQDVCVSGECYFIPATRQAEPARILLIERFNLSHQLAVLLSSTGLTSFNPPPPAHPLPVPVSPSFSPLYAATTSRAPPFG